MHRVYQLAAAVGAAFAVTAVAEPADACGGFFCDGAGPTAVNQAAERIIFAQNPDNSVTAVVQILYEGPTDRFGWLLPVPGIPDVGLSSEAAFQRLQNATNPRYQLQRSVEGECKQDDSLAADGSPRNNDFNDDFAGGPNGTNNGGVQVLAQGATGPYDYVVIQIDSETNKTQIALDWLEDNNYQVTEVGPDLIGPYLDEGYNLLAVRLQKSASAGAIRPLRLTYDTDHPMIPIKLTAVAANADMGVMTWILGPDRAVPVNYKALELNDALINWFNPASNYDDVVTAAANEASGQGFVTEYADGADTLAEIVWTARDAQEWIDLQAQDWVGNEGLLFERTIFSFGGNDPVTFEWRPIDGLDQVISDTMPNLMAEERDLLMQCPTCFVDEGHLPSNFSVEEWIVAMNEHMIEPMEQTQELIDDAPYVTRMYTTMSAEEMTIDPSFDFNPDLDDVSNINTAQQIIECAPHLYQWEAPYRVELPSGLVVRGNQGEPWPVTPGDMMPATLTVKEVGTSGDGMVVRDNREVVSDGLAAINALVPQRSGRGGASGGDEDSMGVGKASGGGGCSVAEGSSGSASGALLLIAGLFAGSRARRRRR